MRFCGVPPCNSPTAITFPLRTTMTPRCLTHCHGFVQSNRTIPCAYLIRQKRVAPENESKRPTRHKYVARGIYRNITGDIRTEGGGSEIVCPGWIAVRVVFDGDKGIGIRNRPEARMRSHWYPPQCLQNSRILLVGAVTCWSRPARLLRKYLMVTMFAPESPATYTPG